MEGHAKVGARWTSSTQVRGSTGSHDYTVKMYDFNGMRRDLRAFRDHPERWLPRPRAELEPWAISSSWSRAPPNRRSTTATVALGEFDKGDMYIRDLKNTKGHCSPCTSGRWHPQDKNTVLTASADGSLRLWDAEYLGDRGAQKSVSSSARAPQGAVTACAYPRRTFHRGRDHGRDCAVIPGFRFREPRAHLSVWYFRRASSVNR